MISIVIPTYNERRNIEVLIPKIFSQKLGKIEVIIVDDGSPDHTAEAAKKLNKKYSVRVIDRGRKMGLASAAVTGFRAAKGNIIILMDGDLSHPPMTLKKLVLQLNSGNDICIGTRYGKGGVVEVWPYWRKMISKLATLMSFPLTSVSDPMSGFIAFRKNVIKNINFSFRGYKIGLEILVKGNYKTISETPYVFRNREVGKSKIGLSEIFNYIIDLIDAYLFVFRHGAKKGIHDRK